MQPAGISPPGSCAPLHGFDVFLLLLKNLKRWERFRVRELWDGQHAAQLKGLAVVSMHPVSDRKLEVVEPRVWVVDSCLLSVFFGWWLSLR